ncbi:SGNH hydrolase, partial [Aureobasidium melanogenum]
MTIKLISFLWLSSWSFQTWLQPTTALTLPLPDRRHLGHEQLQSSGPSLIHDKRDGEPEDPNDQSWITQWAAIGDSYSAGIGCGYVLDYGCARYNFSFPSLINVDERMGDASRDFQFLACSGAESSDVLQNQVPQITDGVQMITVTAGGNDAHFSSILKDCVYGVGSTSICDDRLTDAGNLIQSADFRDKINALLSAIVPKLGENGRIYYVGYAPFFDAASTQCNNVSWDFHGGDFVHTKLTTDLRTRLNVLVSQMNGILEEIINGADDKVIFVDYSGWVARVGGRFCEEGVTEPDVNNEDSFFYQKGTVDIWETFQSSNDARAADPSFVVRDEAQDQNGKSAPEDLDERDAVYLHSIYRVFHPTLVGHSLIANLILYHMGVERAKMLDKATRPMVAEILPSTCSRANEYQDGKVIPQTIDCADTADLSDDYWFDTDTARGIRENFCKYVAGKNQTDISQSHDMESGLGMSYPYQMSGPGNTWIEVWVQNAGCRRPTLYARESVCRVAIDAIVNQCNTESTRKFGGSAAFGTCEEYHMRVGRSWIKFAKIA